MYIYRLDLFFCNLTGCENDDEDEAMYIKSAVKL
jgi:hypothetical protein